MNLPDRSKVKRVVVGALAVTGALALAYVGFVRMSTSDRVQDTFGNVARNVEKATMKPGTYSVQLEALELRDEDWTTSAVVGGPKSVHLTVWCNGREIVRRELGAFRGKKSFLDDPVTFHVPYDGNSVISLVLAETEVLSEGRRYAIEETWPFTHTTIASASRVTFTWKRAPDGRP